MKNVLISVLVVGVLAAAVAGALSTSEFTKDAAKKLAGCTMLNIKFPKWQPSSTLRRSVRRINVPSNLAILILK